MAFVGLKYLFASTLVSESRGTEPTYGKGVILGKMIKCDVNFWRNEETLDADDGIAESDNSISGGDISVNIDDLSQENQEYAMGMIKETGTPENPVYSSTDNPTPYLGAGYMRVRVKNGVHSYISTWIYKTQLAIKSRNAETKKRSITYQTPTLSGSFMGVYPNTDGRVRYHSEVEFQTEKEAYDWLCEKANYAPAGAAA